MELVVLLYALSFGSVQVLLVPQYIEVRLAQARNFTIDKSGGGICKDEDSASNPDYHIQQAIAADTAFWAMVTTTLSYLPPLIISPLVGALSDQLGRKIHLLMPCLGQFLYIGFSLIVFYLEWPLSVYVCGSLFYGIGGGYKCLMGAGYAYISDITDTGKSRLFRMAVVPVVFVGGMSVVQVATGYSIQLFGFITTAWVAFAISSASILYILIPGCLPESHKVKSRESYEKLNFKELVRDVINLFVQNGKKRNQLLVLFLIYFLTDIFQHSQASGAIYIIYGLGPPFCWSSVEAGYFSFTDMVAGALGKYNILFYYHVWGV